LAGLVNLYYPALYRFAFSLTHRESDAVDLTQQTFYIWARKGHQLENAAKVKSWLFTTLHREYLQTRRKSALFATMELAEAEHELPATPPPRCPIATPAP
jgi:DNA-directed RNA polymerase specialized sigma24 family protein